MRRPALWLAIAVSIYLGIACFAYALRHPEMTDTERFLRLWDAVVWR